jgi:tetratricopeptide (TPR) repeat protein
MVEGQKIAAGTYGLHILPNKEECSILFSKYHKAWGSGSLKEADVVLKVNVKPQEIPFREWLSFNFNDRSERSLTAALEWEKTSIPFKISFDIDQVVLENARQELKGTAGFGWQGYMQIAGYCADNDVNLEEAMAWIDESISKSKEFSNLEVKSRLLEKKGKTTAAEQLMKEAIALGNGYQLNFYGYQLMRKEKVHKAIEIFAYNVKKNQDHQFIWGFTDSLAEAYLKAGDKKKALKYYQLAKTKAPENQHKYLDGVIADIKSSLP